MKRLVQSYKFMIIVVVFLTITGCQAISPVIIESTTINEAENETVVTTEVATQAVTEATTEATTEVEAEVESEVETAENILPVRYFTDQLERNNDFVGWLKIDGTNIDAPLLRYTDNDYYLSRDFDKRRSQSGSIYVDYKNIGYFHDRHLAIYGHYMNDGTIFHDLHRFKSLDFYRKNPYVTISGLYETYVYEIFSVQIVSAYDYYLYFDLDDDAWLEYAKHFSRVSMHKKELSKPELLNDPERLKMVTIVTCTYEYDNARLLLHGYMLEKTEMPIR